MRETWIFRVIFTQRISKENMAEGVGFAPKITVF